jgi:hypothetical protein
MSWSALASNQCVSCNNLQNAVDTSVFVLKNTIPASAKQITKAEAESYVYIDTITGKASNQLVVKSNLTAATALPYSYTLYFDFNDGNFYVGFDTSGEACLATNSITVYSSSSTIGIGTALYADAYGTEPILASCIDQIYFKITGTYITFQPSAPLQGDGYIINSIGTCSLDKYLTISSGLYPVTGPNTTITGYIFNNSESDIYVTLVFNSGGQSTGSIAENVDTLNVYIDPNIRKISVYGTITGSGTTLTSQTNSPSINGIITIVANSAPYFFIDKFDGFGSGSTLRIYYSTDLINFSPIPVN